MIIDIAVGVLAALTLLNLFILLGVIRRLREISAATAPHDAGLPEVGSAVPVFAEPTLDGGTVTEERLREGTSLLLFLSPHCAPCKDTADKIHELPLPARTHVFVQSEADDAESADMVAKVKGVGTLAVIKAGGPVATALGVTAYPTAVLVEDGHVAAAGFDVAELLSDRVAAR